MTTQQPSCPNQEMPQEWLQSLGAMTYGLYVITAGHGQNIGGMIASWVSQISYIPPLIMIAVHPNRYTHNLILNSGNFVLHVLDQDQKEFLSRFKGPDPAGKFSGLDWTPGLTGTPVLADCPVYMECRVNSTLAPGNHTLVIGEIIQAGRRWGFTPLTSLDYSGMYVGKE